VVADPNNNDAVSLVLSFFLSLSLFYNFWSEPTKRKARKSLSLRANGEKKKKKRPRQPKPTPKRIAETNQKRKDKKEHR